MSRSAASPDPPVRFRFRDLAYALDFVALVSLGLAAYCLFADTEGIRLEIAGRRILSITRFQRPYFVFLGVVIVRLIVTVRFAPEEFRVRYRSRWGRLKPRLTVLAWIVLALAAAAEFGYRLTVTSEPVPTLEYDHSLYDKTRGGFFPNVEGTWSGGHLITDAHGFRARAGRPQPADGARRVLVLGDSVTFGVGLEAEETLVCVAEDQVRARGIATHFYNAAITGLRTREEESILRSRGLAVNPDAVVVVWCFNDAMPDPEPWSPLVMRLSARLKLFGHIYTRMTTNPARYNPKAINACYEKGEPVWEDCKSSLVAMENLARERGFFFGVLVIPLLDRLEDYPFHPAHDALNGFLDESGIPHCDLVPLFEGKESPPMWVHPTDHHPSAEACRIAGEGFARWLAPYLSGEAGE